MITSEQIWAQLSDKLGRYPTMQEIELHIATLNEPVQMRQIAVVDHEAIRAKMKKFKRAFNKVIKKIEAS